jgi:hypothetical protein
MPTSTRCGSARWRSGATGDAVHDLGRLCEKTDDAAEIPGERRESNALRTHGSSLPIGGPRSLGSVNGLRSPPSTFQPHMENPDASRFSAERDSAGPARRGLDDRGRSLDTSAGGASRLSSGVPRASCCAVDLAPVATPTNDHLGAAPSAQKEPSGAATCVGALKRRH